MKKLLFIVCAAFCLQNAVKADEGMWLPYMLNQKNLSAMKAEGCKLTAEQIFNFNKTSIKDAIVHFGRGCTGEIISPEGLLLTNHHCGLSQIQEHSSPQNDYLTNGFWARSKQEELTNPGLSVSFLTEVKDVTKEVLAGISDTSNYEARNSKINEAIKNLETKVKESTTKNIRVSVVSFYHGNQYLMFTYDLYEDVRLVATPPWGIGKFGADSDNWTWPRHKGDFCLFRVYTAPDGSPAKYSANNIPMKSKHYLPISLKGIQEGDYAMILGYPGRTDRYSPSQKIQMIIDEKGPAIIKVRTAKLDIIRKHSDADQAVFIKYASKQANISNYWKYTIGQVKQLKNNKIVEKKQALEKEFGQWVNADAKRKAEYGTVLSDFADAYTQLANYEKVLNYDVEAGFRGGEAISFVSSLLRTNKLMEDKKSDEEIKKSIEALKSDITKYFKDYDLATDTEMTTALLDLFYKEIPENQLPPEIAKEGKNGDFGKYVKHIFSESICTSAEHFDKWAENPTSLSKDPVFLLMKNIYDHYIALNNQLKETQEKANKANRLFVKGLMEMQKDRNFYPDANSTMRLTYGTVKGYQPSNGIIYQYQTTLEGVMEKEIPGNWEFDVPKKLKQLYEAKDYGRYADKNGELVVNFITTNDITGGNSGSPVIDGNGNLIGLAFDGNWEAMSGDIAYEPEVQRTICMDARYLLFVIDKFAGAKNIMDELTIVK